MPHILVVEDEAVLRLTFEEFLNEEGYRVSTAASYAEAITCLKANAVDVVVSDIILGGHTGIDLLRTIHEEAMDTLVIMITGDPTVETASEAVRLGAFDYLAKPVTEKDLKRVVRLALDRRQVEAERDRYRGELDAIFNGVNLGVFTVDSKLQLRQANKAACEMFDLPPDYQGTAPALLFSEDFNDVEDALRRAAAEGRPTQDIRVEFSSNGSEKRILIANCTPLTIGKKSPRGAVAFLRDITRLTYLEQRLENGQRYHDIVGQSVKMREIFALIEDLSETDSTVLIGGESGTGKELVAEAVHSSSMRADRPFFKVNCAALSEDILESELFGHVKGAFTGAVKDRVGRFEAANEGTLFLDEIGDISPRLQLRLLRVLQEGEFERVGESRPLRVNVRIIAASNQDLAKKITAGEFRQDLYYRLNVVRIDIPPLRDRMEDLPNLVEHFVRRFNRQFKREVSGLAPETMTILMRYPWPGNARELENCLERAFIVCHEPLIRPEHLPSEITAKNLLAINTVPRALLPHSKKRVLDVETVLEALRQTDWNVAKSARRLGIARNTLYQKIKEHDLSRPNDV